jgi:replication factor C subunit 3/5
MFLIDKYYNDPYYTIYHQSIIDEIIDNFDIYNYFYNNLETMLQLPKNELIEKLKILTNSTLKYSNFQHLIIYGHNGSSKEYLINKLLNNIYNKSGLELKEIEYNISGYSNAKTKIMIKQSKHHIIIEPNSNGFDKYLIQEIIQDYAKSELLNIFKNSKLFKIVIINKSDNLSYYAQASLRRTMEKYSDTCKFILICNQLSKIIEPLRSRCLMIRVPLSTRNQVLQTIVTISNKEKIPLSFNKLNNIITKSNNDINIAIWLLEMHKYKIKYEKNWDTIIDNIVNIIINPKIRTNKGFYNAIKKIREKFYILFITNIPTQIIIKEIMTKLLKNTNDIILKYNIIHITSIYELYLNQGSRHIIHIEAYIIKIIELLFNNK